MREKVKDFFETIMKKDVDLFTSDKLYYFYFGMTIIIFVIGILNSLNCNYTLAVTTYITVLLLIIWILCVKTIPCVSIWGLTATFATLLTYYLLSGQNNGIASIWIIIVPIGFTILINGFYSFIISTYFFILIILFCCTPLKNFIIDKYSIEYMNRLPFIYFASYLVSLITSYHNQKYNILQKNYIDQLNNELLRERDKHVSNICQTFTLLAITLDKKDKYKKDHSYKVAEISKQIAIAYGLTEQQVNRIYLAALFHDIGKVNIPEEILDKETPLTDEELTTLATHSTLGFELLNKHDGIDEDIKKAVLYHHERYDGKGYPKGLRGPAIPLAARIIAVADACDAMSSDRSYRDKLTAKVIKKQLIDNSGSQFDAGIVQITIDLINNKIIEL